MRKPYVEMGNKGKVGTKVSVVIMIVLLFTTVLFALLYANAKDDRDVLQNMENYLLEGSTDTLKVSNLLYQYDGKNTYLSGGELHYMGEASDIKGYSFKLILEDMEGIKKPVTLMEENITNNIAALPDQIELVSKSAKAEDINYADLANKYRIKAEFQLITVTQTVAEEVYLKVIDLNTDFFKNTEKVDK